MKHHVKAWEEIVTIPTYAPLPDLYPMFLEDQASQGSRGRVYPSPFTDRFSGERQDQEYLAVWLENERLKLMLLPQLGGRIHAGLDKSNGCNFICRQDVIHPALSGSFGMRISGGVERHWPPQQRPALFRPMQHVIQEHEDGSATVWLSELDPRERVKGVVGVCLRPGQAVVELKVRLYNRTPLTRTFAWQAHAHAHAGYQVVFLPDATANQRHTGAQPEFLWLQPYEVKTFSQYCYPVQKIGPARNANRRAAVSLEIGAWGIRVGVAVTEALERAVVRLLAGEATCSKRVVSLAPGKPFVGWVGLPEGAREADLSLRVCDAAGDEVICYAPQAVQEGALPGEQVPPPETLGSVEELYLAGLHLEQYRHPGIDPGLYWEEGLWREPSDARCHNALGLACLRCGDLAQAATHFRIAIETLTRRNPNPRDGEPFYNLGLALKYQGDHEGARAAFYEAVWSYAWQAAGHYALAELDCLRADWETALAHLERALSTNTLNFKARNLQAAVLRKLGRLEQAEALAQETLRLDPLDAWACNELVWQCRARGQEAAAEEQLQALADVMYVGDWLVDVQAQFDLAFDYANAGLWVEAADALARLLRPHPLALYALGYFAQQQGRDVAAHALYRRASNAPADGCFPRRLEEMLILQHVQALRPADGRVACYLGNLYYGQKRYSEALAHWELAVCELPEFFVPWRNLGAAYYNVRHDVGQAIECYERTRAANPGDGRLLSELDQLLQRAGAPSRERLARLEQNLDLVRQRDDLCVALATLYNFRQRPHKALECLSWRCFQPWAGNAERALEQYVRAHLLQGQNALTRGRAERALGHFEAAGAARPDAHVHYHVGLARQALGDEEGARASFRRVAEAEGGLSFVTYYQALAWRQLGESEAARARLEGLLEEVERELEAEAGRGSVASPPQFVFAGDDPLTQRSVELTYLAGLAYLGLWRVAEARAAFNRVLKGAPDHWGALEGRRWLKRSSRSWMMILDKGCPALNFSANSSSAENTGGNGGSPLRPVKDQMTWMRNGVWGGIGSCV